MNPVPDYDVLAERLFEAARAERPAQGVKQRVLTEAKLHRTHVADGWLGRVRLHSRLVPLAALAASGVVLALFLVKVSGLQGGRPLQSEPRLISAEPLRESVTHSADKQVENSSASSLSSAEQAPSAPIARRSPGELGPDAASSGARPAPRAQRPVRPATLEEELKLLDQVRAALLEGDTSSAFARLGEYDRRASLRQLGAEATLLRIQVLFAAGRREQAAELAQEFSRDNPNNPLIERARSYVQPSLSDPEDVGELP